MARVTLTLFMEESLARILCNETSLEATFLCGYDELACRRNTQRVLRHFNSLRRIASAHRDRKCQAPRVQSSAAFLASCGASLLAGITV